MSNLNKFYNEIIYSFDNILYSKFKKMRLDNVGEELDNYLMERIHNELDNSLYGDLRSTLAIKLYVQL